MNLRRSAHLGLLVAALIVAASTPGCDRSPPANGSPSPAPTSPPHPTRTDVVVTFYDSPGLTIEVVPSGMSLAVMADGRVFRSDQFPAAAPTSRKLVIDRLRLEDITAACQSLRQDCPTKSQGVPDAGHLHVAVADRDGRWAADRNLIFVMSGGDQTPWHPDRGCPEALAELINMINRLDWASGEPVTDDEVQRLTELAHPYR